MKKIIYLAILLLCFTACEQVEVKQDTKFAQVKFYSTLPSGPFNVGYRNKEYLISNGGICTTPVGEVHFIISSNTHEVLLDTVLNIADGDEYRLSLDANLKTIITKNPLIGVAAAPEGYIKISLANITTGPLPYEKVDVVLLSNNMLGANYIPLDTLHGVGTGSSEYFLFKKEVIGTVVQTIYRLGFIDPITGARLLNFAGNEFSGGGFTANALNDVYLIQLSSTTLAATVPLSRRNTALFINAKYYNVNATIDWSK